MQNKNFKEKIKKGRFVYFLSPEEVIEFCELKLDKEQKELLSEMIFEYGSQKFSDGLFEGKLEEPFNNK